MNKALLIATLLVAPAVVEAETLNICVGNVTYAVGSDEAGDMIYDSGTTLSVLGHAFNLNEISSMYVDNSTVAANTVTVTYEGTSAKVLMPVALAPYVSASVEGAHVSITQNDTVGEDTCGEITYELSGESTDGQFYMAGSYKATLELRGLNLTNASGAPIDIQNGKRIEMSIKSGTENYLADCADGSQKGCLVCKGHLELKGKGELTVTANTGHAIYAKEYITLKNATVTVASAEKDGLNCNQYFAMESGTLNISGTHDDGIQVSFKDDTDREAEDTGSITISGGKINIAVTATAAKAIKADGNIDITGGEITASVAGGGEWDAEDNKTKASTCLSADGNITIGGGTLNLTATGSGGKGISADGDFHATGGDVTINTQGGMFVYTNGTEYDDYTGNADWLNSDQKSSPKGIKADGNVVIDGGTFNITTKGNGGEGIESKSELTVNDGTITVAAYDDGLNSSSHMHINGGDITVVTTHNDALDSNGNMYINGGTVRAFGASSPECGLDANEEQGYSVVFTGGYVLAVGGNNSVPSTSASTQPYVSGSASMTAGSTVTLKDGDTVLATFTVPENYSSSSSSGGWGGGWGGGRPGQGGGSGVLITCPGLTSGSSYTLTSGESSSTTVTATLTGNSGGRPW